MGLTSRNDGDWPRSHAHVSKSIFSRLRTRCTQTHSPVQDDTNHRRIEIKMAFTESHTLPHLD
jgi:hypothetical protein